jgi:predicted RNase H-like nuclease
MPTHTPPVETTGTGNERTAILAVTVGATATGIESEARLAAMAVAMMMIDLAVETATPTMIADEEEEIVAMMGSPRTSDAALRLLRNESLHLI